VSRLTVPCTHASIRAQHDQIFIPSSTWCAQKIKCVPSVTRETTGAHTTSRIKYALYPGLEGSSRKHRLPQMRHQLYFGFFLLLFATVYLGGGARAATSTARQSRLPKAQKPMSKNPLSALLLRSGPLLSRNHLSRQFEFCSQSNDFPCSDGSGCCEILGDCCPNQSKRLVVICRIRFLDNKS
jgi:hypothetical protein